MVVTGWRTAAAALTIAAAFAGADDAAARDANGLRLDFLLPETGIHADVGAGLAAHPNHLGSRANVIDAVPVLEIQVGRDLHLSLDDGLTWAPLHYGPLDIGAVVEFRQDYSSPRLARGLRNTDSFEAGGLARLTTSYGDIEGRVRHSLDGDATTSADLSFDTAVQWTPRLALAFEVRGSWSNEAFTIPPSNVRTGRRIVVTPASSQDANYYAVGAEVAAIYRLNEVWRVAGLASLDELIGPRSQYLALDTREAPTVSLVIMRRVTIR